ncbi:PREDICTED: rhotekin-like [Polistes canadensis]|uniref:rhotekin-like n=1 Tax=Polistes canadensis TaxID=91411 RepID=UPI000718B2ED|nr:PREDICTED: rhotekin-like [Polistes canadensis]
MAPIITRGKKIGSSSKTNYDASEKENIYLRRLTDYQTRVRRRNTVRSVRNVTERDLEQKVDVEIQIRDGSTKLLAAARHRTQTLEAARALFISNEKMSMYLKELQRRKKNSSQLSKSTESTATVSLSEIRFPLMWKDLDHFKNRGDYRRFAVFCMARIGTEICDTSLLCPIDRTHTDITFTDPLIFYNVPADFELTLEIYSCMLEEDFSIASTPLKITKTIHSSISRTLGKKLGASINGEINHVQLGPRFELAASAKLTIEETDNGVRTHDLVINHVENKNCVLPLFGYFCCRLAVEPECINSDIHAGIIDINGQKYWARLRNFCVKTWLSKELEDEEKNVIHTIPINKETIIQPSKKSSRKLLLTNFIDGTKKMIIFVFKSSKEAQEWLKYLTTHSKDHSSWRSVGQTIERAQSTDNTISVLCDNRQGSLYDETSLLESIPSSLCSTQRFSVQDISRSIPNNVSGNTSNLYTRSLCNNSMYKLSSTGTKHRWSFLSKD